MPHSYPVDIPNPQDPEEPWINIDVLDSKKAAHSLVKRMFGGTGGRIVAITQADERWVVDLPNPADPEGPWVNVGVYDTKREAVESLRVYGGDDMGGITLVSEIEE